MKLKKFFSVPRNLTALIVWAALIAVTLGGFIWRTAEFAAQGLETSWYIHKVQHTVFGLLGISAIFAAEFVFRFRAPLPVEIGISLFACSANVLGNVYGLYGLLDAWDWILHSLSGVIFSAAGLGLALLLLRNQPAGTRKTICVLLFALLITLALGYLWELFEFTVDTVSPTSSAQEWDKGVIEALPDGTYIVTDKRGTALIDTMMDMFLMLCGAIVLLVPMAVLFFRKPAAMEAFDFRPLPPFRKKAKAAGNDDPDGSTETAGNNGAENEKNPE